MTQLALFQQGQTDKQDICRRRHGNNPESVQAHRHTHKEERYAQILEQLERHGSRGLTLDELSALIDKPPHRLSGRFTELRMAGKIIRTDQKRPTRTGCQASVYRSGGA